MKIEPQVGRKEEQAATAAKHQILNSTHKLQEHKSVLQWTNLSDGFHIFFLTLKSQTPDSRTKSRKIKSVTEN